MASDDFELALLGIVSAMQGGLQGYDTASRRREDALSRMQNRELAERKLSSDERRMKLQEFTELGAPLEDIEAGQRLEPGVPTAQTKKGRVQIGQDLFPREKAQVKSYEGFLERMNRKNAPRERAPGTDQALQAWRDELGQINRKEEMRELSQSDMARKSALESAISKRTGLSVGPSKPPPDRPIPDVSGPIGRGVLTASEYAKRMAKGAPSKTSDEESAIFQDDKGERRRVPKSKWKIAEQRGLKRVK